MDFASQNVNVVNNVATSDSIPNTSSNTFMDWVPRSQRDPHVQILNFLDSNGLLPFRYFFFLLNGGPFHWFFKFILRFEALLGCRDEADQRMENMLPPSLTQLHTPNVSAVVTDHLSPPNNRFENDPPRPTSSFEGIIDVNNAPWPPLYPTG